MQCLLSLSFCNMNFNSTSQFFKYCVKVDRWKSCNRLTNRANINKDNAKKNNLNDFILNITQC